MHKSINSCTLHTHKGHCHLVNTCYTSTSCTYHWCTVPVLSSIFQWWTNQLDKVQNIWHICYYPPYFPVLDSTFFTNESEDGPAATGGIVSVLLPRLLVLPLSTLSALLSLLLFSSSFSHPFFMFLLSFCLLLLFLFFLLSFSINSAKDSGC